MKTLKKTALVASMLLCTGLVVRAELPKKGGHTVENVIEQYLGATALGKGNDLKDIIGADFKHYVACSKKNLNYTKYQFLKSLKASKSMVLNCATDYEFIQETEDFAMVRVDMNFPSFTKSNYISMSNSEEGWIITNIVVDYAG